MKHNPLSPLVAEARARIQRRHQIAAQRIVAVLERYPDDLEITPTIRADVVRAINLELTAIYGSNGELEGWVTGYTDQVIDKVWA